MCFLKPRTHCRQKIKVTQEFFPAIFVISHKRTTHRRSSCVVAYLDSCMSPKKRKFIRKIGLTWKLRYVALRQRGDFMTLIQSK